MGDSNLAIAERTSPGGEPKPDATTQDERIRGLVTEHYEYIWRLMRRLGVPAANAEDAAQDVFIVADRKLHSAWPSSERNFLYAIAVRVAANRRRAQQRHLETPEAELIAAMPDVAPGAEALLDARRAREVTDLILESIPFEQRTVFVLFEIEGLSTTEIADLLQIPLGTVASRLRRGRELFTGAVSRLEAKRVRVGVQ